MPLDKTLYMQIPHIPERSAVAVGNPIAIGSSAPVEAGVMNLRAFASQLGEADHRLATST
jgi:hypothetical protein